MTDSWPADAASALHQWRGLDVAERAHVEEVIANRERYDLGGCVTGGALVVGQVTRPIWTAERVFGGHLDLIAMKEDYVGEDAS